MTPGEAADVEDAPAKVNLALHVRARRADGYHDLETLFAFTRFGDRIEAWPAGEWTLEVDGPEAGVLDTGPGNLVWKAVRAFNEAAGPVGPWRLSLQKRIPVAAGLGGGSADAAATLRLMNRLAGAPLDDGRLKGIAATLGADVPACLWSRPAIGRGTGAELEDLPDSWCDPAASGGHVLLVNPRVAVPTGPVFALWDGADRGPLPPDWRLGRNDLLAGALRLQPVIHDVLAWLRGLPGARHARMSGSGATCLALFEGPPPPVAPPDGWWCAATTLTTHPR